MKMRKKSVLVLVIGPVSLCSPSVYLHVVIVAVLVVVVVLANIMFVCVCFLQCCCDGLCMAADTRRYAPVYRGPPRQRTFSRSVNRINGALITIAE